MTSLSILDKSAGQRVRLASLVWLTIIFAAGMTTFLALEFDSIWPYAAGAMVPGLIGLILSPFMNREWAQVALLFSWIALAVIAVLAMAFLPMAILFLCVPAVASLFQRERVIEALVLAALAAGASFYVVKFGLGPEFELGETASRWAEITAPVGTIVFMIGALFAASYSRKDLLVTHAEALPASEADILDVYPGAAFSTDEDHRVRYSTPFARELFSKDGEAFDGAKMGEILGLSIRDGAAVNEALSAAINSGLNQRTIVQIPAEASTAERDSSVQLDIIPKSKNGAYIYARDITGAMNEVERLREQSRDADSLSRDKDLFFAGVSHELRTPLNAIIGFSDMMRSRLFGPLPGKYSEYADLIHDSGQHMLDLLGDVLDMSKIEAGQYTLTYDNFDLADVVRSSVKMVGPQADNAEVLIEPDIQDRTGLLISADRRAVRQILLNLLSNAIKFSEKGGRIVLKVSANDEAATIRVIDQGRGMSAEELSHIGKPYSQAGSARMVDNRGTGLGLSLVKSLTEMHDGEFDIESSSGDGTTATVIIPRERST
ncbi:sensor histidine kinase [Robiginitomaculum antarcticum]|uniref:sensor histidine kinase n=1 Tax=Robiginitomaculum antarcticum TaxID=437507 RepID=UPI0003652725|nr:HAMP domain-containing sensor histidine kinase [Robiginitomaculum antarcticum]